MFSRFSDHSCINRTDLTDEIVSLAVKVVNNSVLQLMDRMRNILTTEPERLPYIETEVTLLDFFDFLNPPGQFSPLYQLEQNPEFRSALFRIFTRKDLKTIFENEEEL